MQVGAGVVGILTGGILRIPGVLIIGAIVLAMVPVNRWIRHWLTESMFASLAAARREAKIP